MVACNALSCSGQVIIEETPHVLRDDDEKNKGRGGGSRVKQGNNKNKEQIMTV
jgi:hypothetical protein